MRATLTPLWSSGYPFIAYFPAIMASASIGGPRVGLWATLASAFLAYAVFVPMAEAHAPQGLALGFFVGANVILVFLADRIRQARTEAVTRASELTTRFEEFEQSETAVRRAAENLRDFVENASVGMP